MSSRPSAPPGPPRPAAAAAPVSPPSPDSSATRPGELRSTGFGTTGFGGLPSAASAPPAASGGAFDVCHVGVALRALLVVLAALAIGVLFGVHNWAAWLDRFALGGITALPATLLWLLLLCAARRPLAALAPPAQWLLAIGSGVLCGGAGAVLAWGANAATGGLLGVGSIPAGFAPAAAGGALAALLFYWLKLRALAAPPAEATARLAELQSRIRPHFLFNTLNSALTLVRLDPLRAEGVLEDLAELFRVAIADPAESVSLADEIALAQRYLAIEQVRFGDRLRVAWELDAAAGAARVPPLLLQPLVENAVRHGVEPADGGGSIRVRTRVKFGRVLIAISNTLPDAAAGAIARPGNGIALRNVRERLRLMHDVAAQFETRLEPDAYRVQIVLPL